MNHRNRSFRLSAYVQDLVSWVGQEVVFDKGSEVFERFWGMDMSDKQIERVSVYYGTVLEEEEVSALESGKMYDWGDLSKEEEIYYAMLDGAQFLFREEKWKEAKLGRIFPASSQLSESEGRNWISESSYCAHFGSSKEFLPKFDRRLDGLGKIVFVADGAPWIWDWVEAHHPDQTQILDFYHAKEHLCAFAREEFPDPKNRSVWVSLQSQYLLKDQLDLVIEELTNRKTRNANAAQSRDKLLNY